LAQFAPATAPATEEAGPQMTSDAHNIEYPEPEYWTPNVEPIAILHRDSGGYVRFARKFDGDQWENLPALAVSKLQHMFPEFAQELVRDAYFGINTLWQPGKERLTRLNACWVDIDLHRPGAMRTVGQVIGEAIDMVERGEIPRPSMYVYSGRGAWLLWLLVDNEGKRPKAFPEKVLAQQEINAELARRLRENLSIGDVDLCASDAGRMIRVPGSTNSKADPGYEIVQYRPVIEMDLDCRGLGVQYTLASLLALIGLGRSRDEKQAVGWRALWIHRFNDFRSLREMRGGFSEGHRNSAAYVYVHILRGLGLPDSTIERSLTIFAKECCSLPLSRAEQRSVIKHHAKNPGRYLGDRKIADFLNVTAEEGKTLQRWNRFQLSVEPDEIDLKLGVNARREYRKGKIAEIVAERGLLPYRQIAALMQQRGIDTSHVSVYKLMKTMQLPNPPQLLLSDKFVI
jgi:hypothetical protein